MTLRNVCKRWLLGVGVCLLIGTLPARAQGLKPGAWLGKGSRAVAPVRASVKQAVTKATKAVTTSAALSQAQAGRQLTLSFPEPALATGPAVLATPLPSFTSGTFQARDMSSLAKYSGTIFEVDGHVFGAVAAHVLGEADAEVTQLGRYFFADVYHDGKFVAVSAKAVVISPLYDVALVVFNNADKSVLNHPFTLDPRPLSIGQTLSSHGFVGEKEVTDINDRVVVEKTPLSFRTTMPRAQDCRRGLCGSAVVNDEGLLVGVHTGSTRKINPQEDVGYVVPSEILYKLARGYEQHEDAGFELDFDGHKIQLHPNEYLAKLTLFDEAGEVLWSGKSRSHFSHSLFKKLLEEHIPRYVEFTIGRADWLSPYSSYLNYEPAVRVVRYELPPTQGQ